MSELPPGAKALYLDGHLTRESVLSKWPGYQIGTFAGEEGLLHEELRGKPYTKVLLFPLHA